MSLVATLLGRQPYTPPAGQPTRYRPEDYIDARRPKPTPRPPGPSCCDHMIYLKKTNLDRILEAIRRGHHTGRAIQAQTGLSKGTVRNRLLELIDTEEVVIDLSVSPWQYHLAAEPL